MGIQRKILFLVLGVGSSCFLLLGSLSFSGMLQVEEAVEKKSDEILETYGSFSEEYAERLVKSRLLERAQSDALRLSQRLDILVDAENVAKVAERILDHPEHYSPQYLSPPKHRSIDVNQAYIYYNPGVREELAANPVLAEKFALLSNIGDTLEFLSMYYTYGTKCFLASEEGCLIRSDATSENQTTSIYDGPSYLGSYDFRQRPWYIACKQAGKPIFTEVYQSTSGDLEVSCVAPFYDHGKFAGVAGISMTLEALKQKGMVIARENDINFVMDYSGQIVMSSKDSGALSVAGSASGLHEALQEDLANVAREMAEGKSGTSLVTVDDRTYYLVFVPIPDMNYGYVALADKEVALAPARNAEKTMGKVDEEFSASVSNLFSETIFYMGALFFAIFVALVFISNKAAKKFVRPILDLTAGMRSIATGNLDTCLSVKTGDEIETLADSVNVMTTALKSYIEKTKEKERIESELDSARRIQAGMLPSIFPNFHNRKEFAIYASMTPAKEVGGDFYDFYMLGEHHLAITIADVSGKGIPAALFMVIAKTILKNTTMAAGTYRDGKEPDFARMVEQVNRQLCENNKEKMFVTMFFGVLDTETGVFSYVNGGHNPPLIGRNAEGRMVWNYVQMAEPGIALGARKKAAYAVERLMLQPGDMLFLYTDGVTEAMDTEENLYGEERLQTVLNRMKGRETMEELQSLVLEDIAKHVGEMEQSDDITMLSMVYWGV